jgi:CheY-like chemotaxis protein
MALAGAAPPILLVEDDPAHARLVCIVLEKAGLANPVTVIPDGDRAVDYLEGSGPYADRDEHPLPALVLLDGRLPGRDGLEVLAWIRKQPGLKAVPVMMFSGSNEPEAISRAFELGVTRYLVKPVAFDALVDAVSGLGLPWAILAPEDPGD